jgi:hypothetical protein
MRPKRALRSVLLDALSSARPKAPDSGSVYFIRVIGILLTLFASLKNSFESDAALKPYLIMTSSCSSSFLVKSFGRSASNVMAVCAYPKKNQKRIVRDFS